MKVLFLRLFRNRLFLWSLLFLSLFALTACNKKDDGVSPPQTTVKPSDGLSNFLANIENATFAIDLTQPEENPNAPAQNLLLQKNIGSFSARITFPKALIAPNPSGQNLAFLAIPSASSNWPWPLYGYPFTPDQAIDGLANETWASHFGTWAGWFRLDWTATQTIGRIYITYQEFGQPFGQTISSIKYYNLSTNSWLTIPNSSFTLGASRPAYADFSFPAIETTGIIVYLNPGPEVPHPNACVFISEIEVYGGATGTLKIASPTSGDLFASGENVAFIGSQTGTVTNIEWLDNDTVFAQGLSASKSDLSPGTHTITLRGSTAGSQISDSITIVIVKSIKIKDLKTGLPPVEPFKMSSIRGIKRFQAIGCLDDAGNNEIGAVKVKWSLPDGKLDPTHTKRSQILTALNSNVDRIGVLSTQNATATEVLDSDTATFISYFSGNITLKAEFRVDKTHSVTPKTLPISLNQPAFSVKIWPVHGVGAVDNVIINAWQQRTYEAWEKDAIFKINSIEKLPEIQNVVYPNSPLSPLPANFECAEPLLTPILGEIPSFLNPIMFDSLLVKNFNLNLLPRQPHVLFSQRDEPSINAYLVEKVHIYGLSPFNPMQMIFSPQLALAAAKDNYYNFDSPGRLDDKKKSGITISRLTLPFDPRQEKILAHEIGHVLIQKDNLEDNSISGNLMNTGETGGLELSSEQYIAILNFDGKKDQISTLIWEQ